MSDISERYERITGQFSERVRGVPADGWDQPSPCEGWRARDVVGHLTEWIPGFFGAQGVEFPPIPSVEEDPVGAWEAVREAIGKALADPELSQQQVETPFGTQPLAQTVDQLVVGDVFTHTWDLARATGQDEALDHAQLERMMATVGTIPEEAMRADGMFGPRVDVPDDADLQTRFLGFMGRRA